MNNFFNFTIMLCCLFLQGMPDLRAHDPATPPMEAGAATVSVEVVALVDVSCFGLEDGAITVNASGGLPPYTYVWSNGMIGPVLIGLEAGVYTCTATDFLNQTGEITVTVNEPPELELNLISQINIDCGNPEGAATVAYNGGNGIGLYLWSNGATTPTIQNLGPGLYTCTVTDENLCTDVETVEITANLTVPNVTINAAASINCLEPEVVLDGTGSASGSNIAYLWTTVDGHIVSGENSLANCVVDQPGTYTLTVMDLLNDCSGSESVEVVADVQLPAVVIASGGSVDLQIDCITPEITLDGTGSATGANILYLWTTVNGHIVSGGNTLTPVVNAAGTYTLTVSNAVNGCSNDDEVVVTADVDLPLVNIESGAGVDLQIDCLTPEITLSGAGSATGPDIDYLWSTSNGHIVSGETTLENCLVDAGGTYMLAVTDLINGCTATDSVEVALNLTLPTATVASGAGVDLQIDCLTPEITLDGLGSSTGGNFLYLWTTFNGNIVAGANSLEPVVDAAGTYTLTVTNEDNGCVTEDSVQVTVDLDLPIADAGGSLVIDCNNTSVTLDGSASSQGGGFSYLWTTVNGNIVSGENTLENCVVDAPGVYNLLVTDIGNGCSATASVTVNIDVNLPTISIETPGQLGCENSAVTLDATASSSGTGYLYLWTTMNGHIVSGANSLMASVDAAGEYTLTITAPNGCTNEAVVSVSGSASVGVSVTALQHVACFGEASGEISIEVTAGTPPFTYAWSNGMSSAMVSGLSAGQYTVTVTDSLGCAATINIEMEQPIALNVTGSASAVSQAGAADGTASISVSGGTTPYTYLWSNGMTTANIHGLVSGLYGYTVTDANGCTAEGEVIVPQFTGCALVATVVSTNSDCGLSNGTATVTAAGGAGILTYEWSNGMNAAHISGLAGGSYSVTVTDADGCVAIATVAIEEIDILPPTVISQNISVSLDENGVAVLTAAMIDNGSFDACGSVTIDIDITNFDCDDLGPNTVTITVTDSGGNTATGSATVLVVDDLLPVATCPDNMSVEDCSSVVNYDMPTLTDNCSNVNITSTILVQGLPNGAVFPNGITAVTYAVLANTGEVSLCSFNVSVTGTLDVQMATTSPSCPGMSDGTASLTVNGGSGIYTYYWLKTGETTPFISGLSAGIYDALVADSEGCTVMTSVEVEDPAEVTVSVFNISDDCGELGSIDITVAGGTGPYTFVWYDENGNIISTDEDLVDVPAGEYTVEITDVNGCIYTAGGLLVNFLTGIVNLSSNSAKLDVFPNPVSSGMAAIHIELAEEQEVTLELYDMTGQWIATVLPPQKVLSLDTQVELGHISSGSYLLKLFAGNLPVSTRKLICVN